MADAIGDALLRPGIPVDSVHHLSFTLSSNSPQALLLQSIRAYPRPIAQWGLGLHVDGHAAFIGAVYGQVIVKALPYTKSAWLVGSMKVGPDDCRALQKSSYACDKNSRRACHQFPTQHTSLNQLTFSFPTIPASMCPGIRQAKSTIPA